MVGEKYLYLAVTALGIGWSSLQGQTPIRSAAELIERLTNIDDEQRGTFTCGMENRARAIAIELAKQGEAARAQIESALRSIEMLGVASPYAYNGGFLVLAYANLESPSIERLLRLASSDGFSFLQPGVDEAVAAARGLTGYVSPTRSTQRRIICTRQQEPRDALDRLIEGWLDNNKDLFLRALGGRARHDSAVSTETAWRDFRARFWPKDGTLGSVGYRFTHPGRWGQLPEPLSDIHYDDASRVGSIEIPVIFFDKKGRQCGVHRITFVQTTLMQFPFELDTPKLSELLGIVNGCSAASR